MKEKMLNELRRRVKGKANAEPCRYTAEKKEGYIRCGVDGSIRKKGCPCIKYEGRLSTRIRAAFEFILYG